MAAAPNPLLNPNQTLSGPSLLAAAKALTNAQTQGPLTELAKQVAASNQHTAGTSKATAGYFNSLGQFVQSGVNQEGQIGQGLNSTLQGIGQQTQGLLQGIGQGAQQQMLRYSPQSDAQGSLAQSGLSSLAGEIARQRGLAAQSSGAFRNAGAIQGANYQGLAASNLGSYAMQGQQDLKGIAQAGVLANEPLNAKIANIQATKGSLLASNEGKLRQQEINNSLSAGALNVKQNAITAANQRSAASIGAANSRSANSIAAANYRAALSQAGATSRAVTRGIANTANKAAQAVGKPPIYTPTGVKVATAGFQQRSFGQINSLQQLIKDQQAPVSQSEADALNKSQGYNLKAGDKLSGTQIRQLLANGSNAAHTRYDPALIDAAFALVGYGYLTPKQITGLNNLGLIVGGRYKRGNAPTPGSVVGSSGFGGL